MKKYILFLSCFLAVTLLQAQQNVHFHKSDKTIDVFSTSDIEDISFDNEQEVIVVNKKGGDFVRLLESEVDSIGFSNFEDTYSKFNELVDILDGCRSINWVLPGASSHTGKLTLQDGMSIERIEPTDETKSKFGYGYKFKRDEPFIQYNSIDGYKTVFRFDVATDIVGKNVEKYVVGFWIDRRELQGLRLQFTSHSGGLWDISQENLSKKGYVAYQRGVGNKGFDQVEVIEVNGDFTYITIRSDKEKVSNPQLFNLIVESNNVGIKEITIWNPTLLYEEQNIDPYHVYKSESQFNDSPLRGKTVMVMGDSQQNDATISHGIARKLGVNIAHVAMGGHRIAYQKNTSLGTYHGWMYHWDVRKKILEAKADYYFLQVSSNDASGGGSSSSTSTNSVLDNYPTYGDEEATINAKLTLYNALSESERNTLFAYKQTYSAFIKQITTINPDAKIVLATIPISSYQVTQYDEFGNTVYKPGITAESQRTKNDWIFQSIRNDIYELANKHEAAVCDLYNKSGITWENLPEKLNGTDSVHWTTEAKQEFVDPVVESLLSIFLRY